MGRAKTGTNFIGNHWLVQAYSPVVTAVDYYESVCVVVLLRCRLTSNRVNSNDEKRRRFYFSSNRRIKDFCQATSRRVKTEKGLRWMNVKTPVLLDNRIGF